jgi:hypothetical protein
VSEAGSDAEIALTSLAASLVEELTTHQLALQLAAAQEELTAFGQIDQTGGFTPPRVPQVRPWHPLSHLISGGAHMGHAISGGAHMGHTISGMARRQPGAYSGVSGPESQQEGQQEASPAPVLPDRELDRRGLYEAARGQGAIGDVQMQKAQQPEAAPQRPARRPGRRSYYRGVFRGGR